MHEVYIANGVKVVDLADESTVQAGISGVLALYYPEGHVPTERQIAAARGNALAVIAGIARQSQPLAPATSRTGRHTR
jgi:hypothetical protein